MKLDGLKLCVMARSGDCSGCRCNRVLRSTSSGLFELICNGAPFSSDHELSRFEDAFGSEFFLEEGLIERSV